MLCAKTNIQNNQGNYDSNCLEPICPFAPKFYQRIVNQIWNNSHNFNHELSFVVKSVIPYLITPLFGRKWGESIDLRNLGMTAVAIHKYINDFTLEYALRSGHSLEFLGIERSTNDIVNFIVRWNVTHLDLKGFPDIADQFHSESIDISIKMPDQCTDEDFLKIMEHKHNLQEIDFDESTEISIDALEKLTGYHPELVKIPLGAIKYTIEGLLNFVKCCPNLMDVDFSLTTDESHFIYMSDEMLIQFAPLCSNLRNINLKDQWNVTDEGIKAIAENCHNLVSIYCRKHKILEATLDSFANNCTNLRIMELNSHSEITIKVYEKFRSNCPHLTEIILSGGGYEWNILSKVFAKDYIEKIK